MDRKQMEAYRSKKAEIVELEYKLSHIGEGDSLIGHDVIMDYRTGYPMPQTLVGYDFDKEDRLKRLWRNRLEILKTECLEVELWIEEIPDSLTRRIFRMCFVDGLKQNHIAKAVHMAQSNVSRNIDNYIKSHSMHQKV